MTDPLRNGPSVLDLNLRLSTGQGLLLFHSVLVQNLVQSSLSRLESTLASLGNYGLIIIKYARSIPERTGVN